MFTVQSHFVQCNYWQWTQGLLYHPKESSRKKTYILGNSGAGGRRKFMQPYKFAINGTKLWETLRLETLFYYRRTSRNKWPMGTVIAIQEGNEGFVRRVNIVADQMHQKHLGQEYLSNPQINLCCLLKMKMRTILNNNIEIKMKYLEGRSVLMENFMNGNFKSEWTKILLYFFLTNVNIWKFNRIMHMNFSPEFWIQ